MPSVPEKLADLRRVLGLLVKNADDQLVWAKLGDAIEFLRSEAQLMRLDGFHRLLGFMLVLPRSVRDGRLRLGPAHFHFLLILLDYLDALAESRDTAVHNLVPWQRIEEVAFQIDAREAFALGDLPLVERRKRKKSTGESTLPEPGQNDDSVVISLERLDSLSGKLHEVIVRQFQLKKHADLLQTLGEGARSLASQLKGSPAEGIADSLVKDLGRLDSGFKEDMTSLDRSAFHFQEELARFRMVPFELMDSGWKTLDLGHSDLVVGNTSTFLDQDLLRLVQAPLLELVRNAVLHGIEPEAERLALGKPGRGRIEVVCHSDRSSISIEVRDDGRGFDEAGIRASAKSILPMAEEELNQTPTAQLWGYLFEPGVATSGEGLGLSRVKKSLDELQGRVGITESPGKGCQFTLQFPASASLVQGFFIEAGGERFLVSSVFVKEIVTFRRSELVVLPNGNGYRLRDLVIPVLPLASAFRGKESLPKSIEQMIVVNLLGETIGLLVDVIVRHATLSCKPLPDTLAAMKEIQGVVYDEKFHLVPILHVPAIMIHLRRLRSMEFQDRYSPERLEFKNILVIDDGQVSRRTVAEILRAAGYNVEEASDGIEALEILQHRHFHLMVTDEAMPRMDGATFVENLRKQPKHRATPVIVLRGDRDPATQALWAAHGVSVFLDKSNFSRQELLDRTLELLKGLR